MSVPEVVINRLPQYIRCLNDLADNGINVVSSQHLGKALLMTPAQIRKDLSYFGRFGKQGRGYLVQYLIAELRHILGLNLQWNLAVIGVGRLGLAIISYPGFAPDGFQIVAAFDSDPKQVGIRFVGIKVKPMENLNETIRDKDIKIAIVAVPATQTAKVVGLLAEAGIKAILNYTPTSPQTPNDLIVRNIDPVLALQSMTYYLNAYRQD